MKENKLKEDVYTLASLVDKKHGHKRVITEEYLSFLLAEWSGKQDELTDRIQKLKKELGEETDTPKGEKAC